MSDKNQQVQKQVKSYKKYVALAVVVILAAIGIMTNNGTEEKLANSTVASAKSASATEQGSSVAEEPIIARIDITTPLINADEPQFEVYVDNSEVAEKQAEWMHNYGIQGVSIQKDTKTVHLNINPLSDTEIKIELRGRWDKGADGTLVPHYVTYTTFQVNNDDILTMPQKVNFAEPFLHSINAKKGKNINLNIGWQ